MHLPQLSDRSTVDQSVWNAFRQGSKADFENIYRQHIQELFHYGIKIHSHAPLVKDAIQGLFVELWNQRASLSSTDKIKYYLFKALRLKIYRELKSQTYRHQQQENYFERENVASAETKIIETESQEERRQRLGKAMTALPPRQKEVLHLLYSEELSYEQIAELMAINVASVYTLAWKALASLKRLLVVLSLFFTYLLN